jgi:ATP-dependent Lon protease
MSSEVAAMTETQTTALPVLPLRAGVVGPTMVVTIGLDSDEARTAADAALASVGRLLLVPQIDGRSARIGTVAKIEDVADLPDGRRALVVRGLHRARVGAGVPGDGPGLWVSAEPVEDAAPPSEDAVAASRRYLAVVEAILDRRGASRLAAGLRTMTDPGDIADTALYSPDLDMDQRVAILEELDVDARLALVLGYAEATLADLAVKDDVNRNVAEGMERAQREAVLRRQLDAIRTELGEGEADDVAGYRARLDASGAPEAVRAAVDKELAKLERTGPQSPEHSWIITWLDTVLDLPWGNRAEEQLDLADAQATLDADHAGLEDVKERIIELLAVRKLRAERSAARAAAGEVDDQGVPHPAPSGRGGGSILALVGPPGVGKTSLGESVARALGRPFARVALGGVRDESEVRGHRRTYVGARPGRFVRALTEAGAMNPVLLLDEIDKVGSDWRGDPSSALLEVLDPAQNHTFRDHYLEVDLDLSDVVFLATANVLDTIPGPLLDRMEVVRLDGYTEDEKVAIAGDHLLARVVERAGLEDGEVVVEEAALRAVVTGWTREAGVRELERQLGRILRKVAARIAGGTVTTPYVVGEDQVRELLGRPRFTPEAPERTSVPGVATGLAVTGAGGDVLFVETTAMAGDAGLTVTGQLGDVMKESAEIARSFVRANADELGLAADAFEGRRFHVHFPAGAVPKDGPSAGVTMTTALVSLLTGRPVRSEVGMTGEVTLSGRVLPIGGVKQKVLAAHRAGLTEVILPARNEADLDDVPEAVREAMTFHLASDVREVLAWALEAAGSAPATGPSEVATAA